MFFTTYLDGPTVIAFVPVDFHRTWFPRHFIAVILAIFLSYTDVAGSRDIRSRFPAAWNEPQLEHSNRRIGLSVRESRKRQVSLQVDFRNGSAAEAEWHGHVPSRSFVGKCAIKVSQL